MAIIFSSANISSGNRIEIDLREGFNFGNEALLKLLESKYIAALIAT